jgi:proteasome lid subunit RPN8/RPN11
MIIDAGALAACHAHLIGCARTGAEGVGLLSGPLAAPVRAAAGQLDNVTVDEWTPLSNVAEFARYRYEVDGDELVDAYNTLEGRGLRPYVMVHSHLRGGAGPSLNDVRYAANPALLHLIVDLAGPRPHSVLWRLDPSLPVAEQLKIRFRVADLREQSSHPTDLTHGVASV